MEDDDNNDTMMMEVDDEGAGATFVNPFAPAASSATTSAEATAQPTAFESLDPATRMLLTQYAEVREINSSEHVIVMRTSAGPTGVLMSDMDNSRLMKVTAPMPRNNKEWEYLVRTAWPDIRSRLEQDPLFDTRRFFSNNAWRTIFNVCDKQRNKLLQKSGFERRLIPAPQDTYKGQRVERLCWPVGTNREFACVLYTTREASESSDTGAGVTSMVYTLHIASDSVVTEQDTRTERMWRPVWKAVRLLDEQGRSQEEPQRSKRAKKRYKMLMVKGIVKACMGIDNSALFITVNDDGRYTASLYEVRSTGMMPIYSMPLPSKEPSAVACTQNMIILGYSGSEEEQVKGVYVASQTNQWREIKVVPDPIASISASIDHAMHVTLMCGVDNEDTADFLALDIGIGATEHDLDLVRRIYNEEAEGNQMWRGNLWPSHQECMRKIEQSKGKIEGTIRGVCHNIYHCEDAETKDAIIVLTSKDSLHARRFVDAEERGQLRYTNTIPQLGTTVGLGVYNEMVCVHTPENNVLVGNLYTGNFSTDIGGGMGGKATFYYKSVQMYHNRIVVLLSTGHVCVLT